MKVSDLKAALSKQLIAWQGKRTQRIGHNGTDQQLYTHPRVVRTSSQVHPIRPEAMRSQLSGSRMRQATSADGERLATWLHPSEKAYVGTMGDTLEAREIVGWIKEAVLAIVLEVPEPGGRWQPVAFLTISCVADGDTHTLEVGRLMVPLACRRQGYGSTLVRNACLLLESCDGDFRSSSSLTLSRVYRDNTIGLSFVYTLPFDAAPSPIPNDVLHTWFRYRQATIDKRRFGSTVRACREDLAAKIGRTITQHDFSFITGRDRSTIAMIERGQRLPSPEYLSSIIKNIRLLGEDRILALLYSLVGERIPDSVIVTELLPASNKSIHKWIVTDVVGELFFRELPEYLDETVEAIKHGFMRFFFLPKDDVEIMTSELVSYITPRLDESVDLNALPFKVFSAPKYLCSLGIELQNPTPLLTNTKVTIKVSGDKRVSLSPTQARMVYETLRRVISFNETDIDIAVPTEYADFKQLFPRKERRNDKH